jgi:transmembrane sensor
LLQAPAHRQAYAQAQALWRQTEAPAARLAAEEQAGLQQYLEAMRRPARKPHWQRFAVAACLVLALGGVAGWQPQHWLQDLRADYTSAEQVRQVTLADGSQLTLDAGTAIGVDFDQGERRVRLLRGAAFFQVTHTGAPFLVDANGGQVRVLGTQFEVREQGEGPGHGAQRPGGGDACPGPAGARADRQPAAGLCHRQRARSRRWTATAAWPGARAG